jgi:hypothetical protein
MSFLIAIPNSNYKLLLQTVNLLKLTNRSSEEEPMGQDLSPLLLTPLFETALFETVLISIRQASSKASSFSEPIVTN